jgi:hypothetical protein
LTAAVEFKRRGAETRLVVPGLTSQNHSTKRDLALIKAIARGRAWFEELASGRSRSLHELARRDGISRRYALHPPSGQSRVFEPKTHRSDPGRPPTRGALCDASDRTRSADRLDRAAHTPRRLDPISGRIRPSRPHRGGRRCCKHGSGLLMWDCINAQQRKLARVGWLSKTPSRLTVPTHSQTAANAGLWASSFRRHRREGLAAGGKRIRTHGPTPWGSIFSTLPLSSRRSDSCPLCGSSTVRPLSLGFVAKRSSTTRQFMPQS